MLACCWPEGGLPATEVLSFVSVPCASPGSGSILTPGIVTVELFSKLPTGSKLATDPAPHILLSHLLIFKTNTKPAADS